jgi:hypothetical protein
MKRRCAARCWTWRRNATQRSAARHRLAVHLPRCACQAEAALSGETSESLDPIRKRGCAGSRHHVRGPHRPVERCKSVGGARWSGRRADQPAPLASGPVRVRRHGDRGDGHPINWCREARDVLRRANCSYACWNWGSQEAQTALGGPGAWAHPGQGQPRGFRLPPSSAPPHGGTGHAPTLPQTLAPSNVLPGR